MATFDDTPRWMTREAYERVKDKPLPKPHGKKPRRVACPVCGAGRNTACVGTKGGAYHGARYKRAKVAARADYIRRRKTRTRQKRRWAKVHVRYQCPVCGGDHARADHHEPERRQPAAPERSHEEETAWLLAHPVTGGLLARTREVQANDGRARD